ncbi:MAG: RIP metalloprotease RseP [Bacteroidota bacterium]|nr:RIP metalloprotease RseP [Bacteroidota bacterium]
MQILVKAAQFILAISILVTIHEFGHFWAARIFGVKVEKFFLFFDAWGKKLFSFNRKGTEFGMGWLPLGGYVKISGMIDESMDKEFVNSEPKPYEFRSKPAWQRLIIMLGGIFMNVLLGIIIFAGHTWYYGDKYLPKEVLQNGIIAYPLAEKAGFKTGDIITAINDKPLLKADEAVSIKLITEKNLKYTILRDGETKQIVLDKDFAKQYMNGNRDSFIEVRQKFSVKEVSPATGAATAGLQAGDSVIAINKTTIRYFNELSPTLLKVAGTDAQISLIRAGETITKTAYVSKEGTLGFRANFKIGSEKYGFVKSLEIGNTKAWNAIFLNVKALGRVFSGELPARKSVTGLIGIANAYSGTWDWYSFWILTGSISMILAFMNLLPIPALDGGHVLFLLVEIVRGKPLSFKFLEYAQMVGMGMIFLLMGFALFNDFANIVQSVFKI